MYDFILMETMKIFKYMAMMACGAMVAASVISCHKKDDEDDTEYMDGTLTFELPGFLESGAEIELTPSGVTYGSDKKTPGYYWYTSEVSAKDTTRYVNDPASVTGKFLLQIPEDFKGTLTVTCSAYASGYYLRTQSSTVEVVNQETSLSIPGLTDQDPMFTDPRDGKTYRYISINGLDWFARNLAYAGGTPSLGTELLRNLFGTFYKWGEAKTACPDGWRLPNSEDWKSLAIGLGDNPADGFSTFRGISGKLMTDASFNGEKLWQFNNVVKLTGESGFAALPLGYANIDGTAYQFTDFYNYSVFWTADELNEEQAYYRYLYVASKDVSIATGHKNSFAVPVRCVRESI